MITKISDFTSSLTPLMLFALVCPFYAGAEPLAAPIAQWNLTEGEGAKTVEQEMGSEAKIHGATWLKLDPDFALHFDGIDDFVRGGEVLLAGSRKAITLEVWVRPDQPAKGEPGIFGSWFGQYALTFYRGSCWFYIGSGGNKVHVPLPVGRWSHIVATFDGTELRMHINGQKAARNASTYDAIPAGDHVYIGAITPNPATAPNAYFAGSIGGARIYNRALNWREAAGRYNAEAAAYGQRPVDVAAFDTLGLRLFPYLERGEVVARVDYSNVTLPFEGLSARVAQLDGDSEPVEVVLADAGEFVEVTLRAPDDVDESLRYRATLLQGGTVVSSTDSESLWAERKAPVPDIKSYRVPPLPPRPTTPAFTGTLNDSGGITLESGGDTYRVASRFSYPHGGYNALGDRDTEAEVPEAEWGVSSAPDHGDAVVARGKHYQITRRLVRTPTRIEVTDEIENKTDDTIGVTLEHRLEGPDGAVPTLMGNPTVFLAGKTCGVGLVALDDVFYLRAENRMARGAPALLDHHLGIPPKGSHTVRWAIYPIATTAYFDFINQVRRDEGINGHVPGGFGFTTSWEVPTAAEVANKSLAFYSWGSLTRILRDPIISLEGWEFTDYPEMCDLLRTWIGDTRQAHPELETTFHVAHSLFATDKPKEIFPDSLAIDRNGDMLCYGGNSVDYYNRYFSPELVQDGWRWWIYYPTMENSYGQRMLDAADYMIQNLGATSVWADGYISGYVREGFTHDHWDGLSVTIDPASKLITAEKALVPHVSMPVLKAVAQKYTDAGGYLITNGKPGPFSFTRLPVISSCETSGGDQLPISQLHLGSTVTPLGAPSAIKTFQDVYDDILSKLDHGALYFWHGEGNTVREPTIVSEMYPITFESIHPGTVRGKERIVTKVSGVYGWPGSRDLHRVHFYGGRGRKRPHGFVTTVDEAGVRTEVVLKEGESAVIERLLVRAEEGSVYNMSLIDSAAEQLHFITSRSPRKVHSVALSNRSTGGTLLLGSDGEPAIVD